jgi:hypothetical protein
VNYKGILYLLLIICATTFAVAQQPGAASLPCGQLATLQVNWAQFHFDACHTGYNPYEKILSTSTVPNLVVDWQYNIRRRSWLLFPIISWESATRCFSGLLRPEMLTAQRKQVGDSPKETIFSLPSGSTTAKGSWLANAAHSAPISVSPATTETR